MDRIRKYEAATERSMYKALKEFHQLEAQLKATRIPIEEDSTPEELASSSPEDPSEADLPVVESEPVPRTPPTSFQTPETGHFPAKRILDTAPNLFGYEQNGIC